LILECASLLRLLYALGGELSARLCFAMLVLLIRILEGMFVLGALGCVLVFVLTAIDDIRVLFSRDDDKHPTHRD
jgi:hypothetical protein